MNRKIFAILSLAIIAIVCVGTASALDFGSLLGGDDEAEAAETQNVTIGGIDFAIPAAFEENKSLELVDEPMQSGEVEYIVNEKTFVNSDDVVSILVGDYGEYKVTDELLELMGGEKTKIGDVDGYLDEDNGFYTFSYPKDDKLVAIVSSSDKILEDFVA